jgi:hypothetical protein
VGSAGTFAGIGRHLLHLSTLVDDECRRHKRMPTCAGKLKDGDGGEGSRLSLHRSPPKRKYPLLLARRTCMPAEEVWE